LILQNARVMDAEVDDSVMPHYDKLVAAETPWGIGVWRLEFDAYGAPGPGISTPWASNGVAERVSAWPVYRPGGRWMVDPSDVLWAQVCVLVGGKA